MAVIHIPEAEAAKDLGSLMKKAALGDEIIIDGTTTSARLMPQQTSRLRTVGEALLILKERGNIATGDPGFADDLQFVVDRMRSVPTLPSPWD
jgi:hypothetical protein